MIWTLGSGVKNEREKILILHLISDHMDTKLTLSMDKAVIEEAKKYARKKNTSLSKLIENHLLSVTKIGTKKGEQITPLVRSLTGVLKLSGGVQSKKNYADHLASKYQ
jgi:hypothetical protein